MAISPTGGLGGDLALIAPGLAHGPAAEERRPSGTFDILELNARVRAAQMGTVQDKQLAVLEEQKEKLIAIEASGWAHGPDPTPTTMAGGPTAPSATVIPPGELAGSTVTGGLGTHSLVTGGFSRGHAPSPPPDFSTSDLPGFSLHFAYSTDLVPWAGTGSTLLAAVVDWFLDNPDVQAPARGPFVIAPPIQIDKEYPYLVVEHIMTAEPELSTSLNTLERHTYQFKVVSDSLAECLTIVDQVRDAMMPRPGYRKLAFNGGHEIDRWPGKLGRAERANFQGHNKDDIGPRVWYSIFDMVFYVTRDYLDLSPPPALPAIPVGELPGYLIPFVYATDPPTPGVDENGIEVGTTLLGAILAWVRDDPELGAELGGVYAVAMTSSIAPDYPILVVNHIASPEPELDTTPRTIERHMYQFTVFADSFSVALDLADRLLARIVTRAAHERFLYYHGREIDCWPGVVPKADKTVGDVWSQTMTTFDVVFLVVGDYTD